MLQINLKGKKAFIAGIGDDQGYGWAIAKALAEAGATILIGTWTPILKIFTMSLQAGKFDASRRLSDGSLMEFAKIYALDASFDRPEDIPEEIIYTAALFFNENELIRLLLVILTVNDWHFVKRISASGKKSHRPPHE